MRKKQPTSHKVTNASSGVHRGAVWNRNPGNSDQGQARNSVFQGSRVFQRTARSNPGSRTGNYYNVTTTNVDVVVTGNTRT